MVTSHSSRRAGGRRARHAQRAKGPDSPAPPGQRGGQYQPLSDTDVTTITDTAFRLLSDLGLGDVPARLATDLVAAGATLQNGRALFPRALVETAIDAAAKTFTLHARDPDRSIEVGGARVYYGTGGAAVQTLDPETQSYRSATYKDLCDFTRLQDGLDQISWFTRCCVATDIPDIRLLDLATVLALVRHTTKPLGTSFTLAEHVDDCVALLDIAAGGPGAFAAHPFLKAHISPIISPLKYGEDAVDVTYACIDHNIPLNCIVAAQAGATGPATPAGFLAQSLAETLACLVMVHAIKPGHPLIFSNWPFVVDLRTGAFAGGGGETALLNAAAAQLSNRLGLPSGVASSMTDAKAIDAQYGAEKAATALAAGLAGGNLIYESAGMTAALLGASFEGMVLDNDMLTSLTRVLRGVEVTEETLSFDAICAAVRGEGHFLGADGTLGAMERDYVYPTFADRDPPVTWAENGQPDAWTRARAEAMARLAKPGPTYLSPAQEAEIALRFPELASL